MAIFWKNDEALQLSDFEIETAVSVTVGAAAVGTAVSGMPLQWYGRKPLILSASALYVLGSSVLAVANGFAALLAGRLLLGLGVGLSSIAVPVYLAEVAPPSVRGRLVASYTLSIVFGQVHGAKLFDVGYL